MTRTAPPSKPPSPAPFVALTTGPSRKSRQLKVRSETTQERVASDAGALMQAVITAPQRPPEANARPLLRRSRDSPTPDHMRQAPLSLGRQFEMAAIEGDVGGMRDLLAVGVKLDLNATLHFGRSVGYCALYHAASSSHVAATRHLIGLGVELPDDEQWVTDALCNAAKDGDLGLVRLLVSAGADFSAAGSDGMTALDHAVRKSHMDLVAFLNAPSRVP